jgi:hypothetical protein
MVLLQEAWVREWVRKRTGFEPDFKITFYCARYDNAFKSIFPVGDVTNYIPEDEVCALLASADEQKCWVFEECCPFFLQYCPESTSNSTYCLAALLSMHPLRKDLQTSDIGRIFPILGKISELSHSAMPVSIK